MKEESRVPAKYIASKILHIRGEKVMIDSDIAALYGVTTKRLNQQVNRNIDRFPVNFMFELSAEEKNEVVANCNHLKNLKFSAFLPKVFTEHGVLMLANVLRSEEATAMSVQIIEIFVEMRQVFVEKLKIKLDIEEIKKKQFNHSQNIELVFNYLDELMGAKENKKPRTKIGYKKEDSE